MTMKRKRLIITVAAVSVTAAVAGGGYAVAARVTPESRSGFCAAMPDAVGLYAGNPVTQMGYRIGRIDRIEPKGDHVEVTFSLTSDRRLPADVKAVTRSKSLLADRSLELVGNHGSGAQLASGSCIPLSHSFTPKSISEIAGSAADFIDAMAPADGKQSFQSAVAGFDDAMRGNDQNARALLQHAASAAQSPDQLISDIGSSIMNMAPLTDEALQRWATLRSILDQMPGVLAAGIDLWSGPTSVAYNVGWLVATLNDIQHNYGDTLWPFMKGPVADVIHLAATRSKDIASLLSSIPPVAAMLRQQSGADGLTMSYQPPTVDIGSGAPVPVTGLLDLVLAKGK
ncbi:MlaD family protein [Nocardia sp. NPDC059246]|uniref:MlaD family protein n=1 Tax=unclassified Nocardia TaxID=2637762 RepID=UPI003691A422